MARTKASRLSQAGRRGVDAGVGDTTRTAREGAAFPPPAQEPSERESLARACPETPSTSDSPPTQPPTSADRASDDDARVARSPRDAFAALVAPRATRRAPVRDRPTDNLPGVHAASGVPALARQAPPAEPRVEATPKARTVRFSRHVHGAPNIRARPRARAYASPPAPFPARRVPRTRRGGTPLSASPAVPRRNPARSAGRISRERVPSRFVSSSSPRPVPPSLDRFSLHQSRARAIGERLRAIRG